MLIRNARPDDLDKIAALYVKNHLETYRGLLSEAYLNALTPAWAREKWAGYLTGRKKLWCAFEDGAFLGFVAGAEDAELPGVWYLDSLHVVPEARGKGVGTALLRTCGAYAKEAGYRAMSICIVRGNERARRLYEKLGAAHYKNFEDDFRGTVSQSEKLLWRDLGVFR